MKTTLYLFSLVSLFIGAGCDSDDDNDFSADIPSVVLNAFEAEYPNASDVDWKVLTNNYEVDFEIENVDYEALFNAEGDMLKYKYEIVPSELPETVKNTLASGYANKEIDDIEILVIENEIYYQVELEANPDIALVLNEAGEEISEISYWD